MPAGCGTVKVLPDGAEAPGERSPRLIRSPSTAAGPEPSAESTSSTRSYTAPAGVRVPALVTVHETGSGAPTLTDAGDETAETARSGYAGRPSVIVPASSALSDSSDSKTMPKRSTTMKTR